MVAQKVKSNWLRTTVLVLVLIAVIVVVLALGRSLWLRFGIKQQENALFVAMLPALEDKISQNQLAIQELQNTIQKQGADKTSRWKSIAIEYLIRMADLTLHTTGDVKTALTFLLTAKKYTNDFPAPALLHALNKDIASLQAVPVVDVEALVLKIDMVSQQVNALPVVPLPTVAVAATIQEKAEIKQHANKLKLFFISAVQALKDIVIIRHRNVDPILPPEQVTILRLNIQAKLLQAEFAVMQKQNKLYQACLSQVIAWINQHFTLSDNITTSVLHTLQELQQVNLQPKLPVLTESLVTLPQNIIKSSAKAPQPERVQLL